MKRKKNRFISVISSLFGIAALCGIFSLTSLSKKEADQANADGQTVYYRGGYNGLLSLNGTYFDNVNLGIVGNFTYNKLYQNGEEKYQYQFNFNFTLYDTNLSPTVTYPLYVDEEMTNTSISYYSPLISGQDNNLKIQVYQVTSGANYSGRVRVWLRFVTNNTSFDTIGNQLPLQYSEFETQRTGIANMDYANIVDIDFIPYADNQYDDGYNQGYTDGYNVGYNSGNINGYNEGYEQGNVAGKEQQSQDDEVLITQAYQQGYSAGYEQGNTQDQTVSTIFSGIMSVAMVPVDFFLAIFNFEILGINISAMVTALLSLAITIVVIKLVMGKKGE